METPALMEAQTVPTSARYIDKLTTVGTCSASMENEATRTHWPVLSFPLCLSHSIFISQSSTELCFTMAHQTQPSQVHHGK